MKEKGRTKMRRATNTKADALVSPVEDLAKWSSTAPRTRPSLERESDSRLRSSHRVGSRSSYASFESGIPSGYRVVVIFVE